MKDGAIFMITHSTAGGLHKLRDNIAKGLRARGHPVGRFVLYSPADPEAEGVDRLVWYHVAPKRPRTPLTAIRVVEASSITCGEHGWLRSCRLCPRPTSYCRPR